jgi:SAM-dependent methyltransferase
MSMLSYLRSFRERRIVVPVARDALVLDVGSGDKPSWRADVLLDGYPDDAHQGQRSGTGGTRVSRPLFRADAADMPFADNAFDYVICSHVLEHVPDPSAVIAELTRIARAGYIEVPEASAAKLQDFPTHLWWCRLEESGPRPTLLFTAKSRPYFDAEIDAYLRRTGLEKRMARMLESRFQHNIVSLRWEGDVPHRVDGKPDPEFIRRTLAADAPHHAAASTAARILTRVMVGRGHPRRPLLYDDLVKPELRTGRREILEPRIYDIDGR